MLLEEFFRQDVDKKLAPKTIERYHEQAVCLSPELLAMTLGDITPLHLNREWNRLLQCGGRTRREKTPRPLSAKSVRSIAGVVSSAFLRAVRWGLIGVNPVTNSEPPVPKLKCLRFAGRISWAATWSLRDRLLRLARRRSSRAPRRRDRAT